MKLWSQGLGKRTLALDFQEGELIREGNELLLQGVMGEPVWWEYTVHLTEEDIVRIFRLAICRSAVDYVLSRRNAASLLTRLAAECFRLPLLVLKSLLDTERRRRT